MTTMYVKGVRAAVSSFTLSREMMSFFFRPKWWILLLLVIFCHLFHFLFAQPFDYPSANLSTFWTNNDLSIAHHVRFDDGSQVRSILLRGTFGPRFACGFFCNGTCDSFLFAIFIVQTNSASLITSPSIGFPQVVWSANRNRPVKQNATLQLTKDGDLVLTDVDGTKVWSTNTSGMSVAGMNMSGDGNLVLFNRRNQIVWQSFDHPTDALVLGQRLVAGKRLTASVSVLNSTEGEFFVAVNDGKSFAAYIESDPLQVYYRNEFTGVKRSREPSYVKLMNGSLSFYILSAEPSAPDSWISLPQPISVQYSFPYQGISAQYLKLDPDGHFRLYDWESGWKLVRELFSGVLGDCSYPTVCGSYGICSNGQCSCPTASDSNVSYFRQTDARRPNVGCSEVTPLTCHNLQDHQFLDLQDITYFNYDAESLEGTDAETCKAACMRNCTCKAALFRYGSNASSGSCYLPSTLFSLINNPREVTHYNSSAFIKVQIPPPPPRGNSSTDVGAGSTTSRNPARTGTIVAASVGASVGAIIVLALGIFIIRKRMKAEEEEEEDDCFQQVPGMSRRFSYEDLKIATKNFSAKLGQGGFGSVFEGILGDGTKIAVKRLDKLSQGKKEFLAEVETIGRIHHLNLVRLVGFCGEKSYRLLVYEYMCNGSLDKWIFKKNSNAMSWKIRREIILDIAKGLAYLHEECEQIIAHLDVKPQNILLNEDFKAKVSDFGLAKLIERDQSQVMTMMRGTPGYLAPEWLNSKITEKVDVYSFGVMILEIVCGRKNLDYSQPEEKAHLLGLFKTKAQENRMLDLVEGSSYDVESHEHQVLQMFDLAAWCLQGDCNRRPSMSAVVKVLEGVMEVDSAIDYSLACPTVGNNYQQANMASSSAPSASLLSGPR